MLAAAILAAGAASAVEIGSVQVANVSTTSFTLVWTTSEVSTPGLDIFADVQGDLDITSMVGREFFPVSEGDPAVVNDAAARESRSALAAVVISRAAVVVRVTGLEPGTTYFVRPRTFGGDGADNGSGPLPLRSVTTAAFTSLVQDARLLRVGFPGIDAEGMVAILHGPAGTQPVAVVVGDGTGDGTALFPLSSLIDGESGTNALFDTPQDVFVTLHGTDAPLGAFPETVDFAAGFGAASYESVIAGTPTTSPIITAHPVDWLANPGGSASFTVAASGDPAPTFQWQRKPAGAGGFANVVDDATYAGATTATLIVNNLTLGMSGDEFRAVAANGLDPAATSNAATLTVVENDVAPVITSHPQSIARGIDQQASFTVAATGLPAPTYQWFKDGNPVTGATSATFTIQFVTALDAGSYTVVVTNRAGSATSNAAILTVDLTPPPPPAAPILAPLGIVDYDTIRVTWPAVSGATGYRIDVSSSPTFATFVAGYQNFDAGPVNSVDVEGLRLGTYYVRIRSYNTGGTSPASTTLPITIGGRLLNLSTRAITSTGADVMIAGFVVQGNQPKQLVIRAVGPTLAGAPYNVAGTVPDPLLRVFRMDPDGPVVERVVDDWDSGDAQLVNAMSQVGAFPITPGSKDAAMLVTLQPSKSYTTHVESVTGASGVAIVEVYEVDAVSRLINISTRAFVGTGDGIEIAGFFMKPGGGPKRLLIRAVGETLGSPPFNVPGVLVDPTMTIVPTNDPGTNPSFFNDDWGTNANASEIAEVAAQVGAFPINTGSKDAAMIVVLDPAVSGGYTIQVRGKNGETGVVIAEVYEVP